MLLGQGLRRQHMGDFAGADAESKRAKTAVGIGVAVGTDQRHVGQRQPEVGQVPSLLRRFVALLLITRPARKVQKACRALG